MEKEILSRCGMRCDLCLLYRPNVDANDRRREICAVFEKVWQGYHLNPTEVICDGCTNFQKDALLFSKDCPTRQCVVNKGLTHCGYCSAYPCDIFPAEPSEEELHRKIDIEKQWTWEEESLMEAYSCKKYMDAFRAKQP